MSRTSKDVLERLLTVSLTLAVILVSGSVAYRTFVQPPVAAAPKPTFVDDWKTALTFGNWIGDSAAPITIVELADLQCPACRGFQKTIQDIRAEYPRLVSVAHVSYPLSYHEYALPAAKAGECARQIGQFEAWANTVYGKQDSLGKKSWASFAADAGISDTARIAECASTVAKPARIEGGIAFGDKIAVTGTPTIIVNGWRLSEVPSKARLKMAVEALERGENPFKSSNPFRPSLWASSAGSR